ncbi:hypothetical protein ABTL16_19450, partial [Acinetobacter baumannii]
SNSHSVETPGEYANRNAIDLIREEITAVAGGADADQVLFSETRGEILAMSSSSTCGDALASQGGSYIELLSRRTRFLSNLTLFSNHF